MERWALIHVERRAGHEERVFAGQLAAQSDGAPVVTLPPARLAHLNVQPHGVAEALRRVHAAGGDPFAIASADSQQTLRGV